MNSGAGTPCQNGREPGKRRSANSPRGAFWRGAPTLGVLAGVLFVSGCGGGPGPAGAAGGHGFASFPDPTFSGSGVRVPSLSAADPTDPGKATAAQHACAHYLSST
jgi:hypothetical protein